MLVFNMKQVNLYNDFWINSKYDFSKYLSHENTGYVLMSVAFLSSHSSMKEALIKQKLNAVTFLHNQWLKVGYEMICASWCLNQTDHLFPPHDSLFVHQLTILFIFCLLCYHPMTDRHTSCIASVGLRKKITITYMKIFPIEKLKHFPTSCLCINAELYVLYPFIPSLV